MTEKNIELMKKLKALAEKGVGGERDNAKELLDRLMEKYDVEEADLSDDKLEDYTFRFEDGYERKILNQVIYKISPERSRWRYTRGKGSRTMIGVTCTKAEAVQIEIEYEFYRNLLKDELDMFLLAFIQKHRLFDERPNAETATIGDEEAERMVAMMAGMQDKTLKPMIGDGGDDIG